MISTNLANSNNVQPRGYRLEICIMVYILVTMTSNFDSLCLVQQFLIKNNTKEQLILNYTAVHSPRSYSKSPHDSSNYIYYIYNFKNLQWKQFFMFSALPTFLALLQETSLCFPSIELFSLRVSLVLDPAAKAS